MNSQILDQILQFYLLPEILEQFSLGKSLNTWGGWRVVNIAERASLKGQKYHM